MRLWNVKRGSEQEQAEIWFLLSLRPLLAPVQKIGSSPVELARLLFYQDLALFTLLCVIRGPLFPRLRVALRMVLSEGKCPN